jgi:hypothetical protein
MAATSGTTHTHDSASRSTAAALKETAGSAADRSASPAMAAEGGASPEAAAAEGESDMLQSFSRVVYSGCYALAYGVVYATVFVAQSLPQENPVMHGFRDGGRAAMDELSSSL